MTACTARGTLPGLQPWLRSARWDVIFITGSVAVAAIPYSIYAVFGGSGVQQAAIPGTAAYQARVAVNLLVTVLIAGPHMYATFSRTLLDTAYARRHLVLLAMSGLVPFAVIAAAVSSYASYVWLLTIFFGLASIHSLHQIVWITQAYNRRANHSDSVASRLIDYALVFCSLYPIAVNKMVRGEFRIGPVYLEYNRLVYGWFWLPKVMGAVFAVLLILYIAKTVAQYRSGCLNIPKTLLIGVTVPVMLLLPAFPNMDTSFQGANAWHSFQYLALTWYANQLRLKLGGHDRLRSPTPRVPLGIRSAAGIVRAASSGGGWITYYLLCLALVPVAGVAVLASKLAWPGLHAGDPGADEVYRYMIVLSILLVHYFQDTFLFTDPESIIDKSERLAVEPPGSVGRPAELAAPDGTDDVLARDVPRRDETGDDAREQNANNADSNPNRAEREMQPAEWQQDRILAQIGIER